LKNCNLSLRCSFIIAGLASFYHTVIPMGFKKIGRFADLPIGRFVDLPICRFGIRHLHGLKSSPARDDSMVAEDG